MAGHVVQRDDDRAHRHGLLLHRLAQYASHAGESMTAQLKTPGFWHRLRALIKKEFNQIRRDRRLMISLIIPPTLQILLFGFALNSNVSNLRLGILDESKTPESRELIADLTESKSFRLGGYFLENRELDNAIGRSKLDAGVVIPWDFARNLQRGQPTNVQFIMNAVNANTAAIGQGYAEGVLVSYNRSLASRGIHPQIRIVAADQNMKGSVNLNPAFLFNPGLVTAWLIVTGTFGTRRVLTGSLWASTAVAGDGASGALEQLLMTPAGTTEIVVAKLTPLFGLLVGMVVLSLGPLRFFFVVPLPL